MTATTAPASADPREAVTLLYRDLRTSANGLAGRDAARRLTAYGPNELRRRGGRRRVRDLAAQFSHPLALLLWLAAVLSAVTGTWALVGAIVAVIVLNALFAFVQENRAERAVEALAGYLPQRATVLRDGHPTTVPARELVPGDVVLIAEGDRICADGRLIDGGVEVDLSTLTGESLPVYRSADLVDTTGPVLDARDLVFSGSACTRGEARAVVVTTGMNTEIGRIAALTERVGRDDSPLERQVKRVAWLIATVAVAAGLLFFPIGVLAAGMPLGDAANFAIGLLVANVPEGLLPTITLALAVGVRGLARLGAIVKRLSAVETLGSTAVICTDKTGTLTRNRLEPTAVWTADGGLDLTGADRPATDTVRALAAAVARCNTALLDDAGTGDQGDPTELALLVAARRLGVVVTGTDRRATRRALYAFDPALRLMSTVDSEGAAPVVHTKGAPEAVVPRCDTVLTVGGEVPLDAELRGAALAEVRRLATGGQRVIAAARRVGGPLPADRTEAETGLCLLGLVAMVDPPRPEVADAVRHCRTAGIRVIVVTGDHPDTAAHVARQVGIADEHTPVRTGADLDRLTEPQLDDLLSTRGNLVIARAAPEAKLRIADALRELGNVVAMTGDGVNDAPALHHADIGVAMGRSGTDVAREASDMILTDDNFATIVAAVRTGRRVYDNVRKFILYIFAHAVPEVVPFLVFALSGGAIPLPLTVLQILAIDLGTETLPALALGREPAEPGLMRRPPRPRGAGIIDRALLVRAWGLLGSVSAVLVLGGFFAVLLAAGWRPGADVTAGSPLHEAYLQATTTTFLGIVACQVGTAFAARTDRASLRSIGVATNRMLLWGILFELVFAAAIVVLPGVREVFGNALPAAWALAMLPAYAVVVWAVDELRRAWLRRTRP